jgi:hypothetical protein
MEYLKKMMTTFIYALAGTTIAATIFITIFASNSSLRFYLLWQIIGMSLACACGNLIYFSKGVLGKKQMKVRIALHYLYINVMVIGGGLLWEWLTPSFIAEVIVMFLLIVAVYVSIMLITFRQEKRTAELLNRRLKKLYPSEEEKEDK